MPDSSKRMARVEITYCWKIGKIGWLHELKDGRVNKLRGTRKVNSKRLKRQIEK